MLKLAYTTQISCDHDCIHELVIKDVQLLQTLGIAW